MKSRGGNRLQIEDTDGSSDEEEVREVDMKQAIKTAPVVTETPIAENKEPQKKEIKITEVETDEDEEEEEEVVEAEMPKVKPETIEPPVVVTETKIEAKPQPVDFDLPKNVIQFKDKALNFFSSGQYGDAVEQYALAIDSLNKSLLASKSKF